MEITQSEEFENGKENRQREEFVIGMENGQSVRFVIENRQSDVLRIKGKIEDVHIKKEKTKERRKARLYVPFHGIIGQSYNRGINVLC